jgi:extradiol dioxygenase family protein
MHLAGAVIYAWDVTRLADFYERLTDATVTERHHRWVIFDLDGSRLVIHGSNQDSPDASLGQRRDETPLKLTFVVDDVAATRQLVLDLGGGAVALDTAWRDGDALFVDAWDLEGNVFTLRGRG